MHSNSKRNEKVKGPAKGKGDKELSSKGHLTDTSPLNESSRSERERSSEEKKRTTVGAMGDTLGQEEKPRSESPQSSDENREEDSQEKNEETCWLESEIEVPQFVVKFTELWLEILREFSEQKRPYKDFIVTLFQCLNDARSPYWSILHMIASCTDYEEKVTEEKESITLGLIDGFKEYVKSGMMVEPLQATSNDIKMAAFLVAFRQAKIRVQDTIVELFELKTEPEIFVPQIKNEIEAERYDVAYDAITQLKLQSHFTPEETLAMLLVDDFEMLEEYSKDDNDLRHRLVAYLDQFCVNRAKGEPLIQALNIPNDLKERLKPGLLTSVLAPFVRNFDIPIEVCRNFKFMQRNKVLFGFLSRKYIKGVVPDKDFDLFVKKFIRNSKVFQRKLVFGMARHKDFVGAAHFAAKFGISMDMVPETVKVAMENGTAGVRPGTEGVRAGDKPRTDRRAQGTVEDKPRTDRRAQGTVEDKPRTDRRAQGTVEDKPRTDRRAQGTVEDKPRTDRRAQGTVEDKPRTDRRAQGTVEDKPRTDRRAQGTVEDKPRTDRRAQGTVEDKPRTDRRAQGTVEDKPRTDRRAQGTVDDKPRTDRRAQGTVEDKPRTDRRAQGTDRRAQGTVEEKPRTDQRGQRTVDNKPQQGIRDGPVAEQTGQRAVNDRRETGRKGQKTVQDKANVDHRATEAEPQKRAAEPRREAAQEQRGRPKRGTPRPRWLEHSIEVPPKVIQITEEWLSVLENSFVSDSYSTFCDKLRDCFSKTDSVWWTVLHLMASSPDYTRAVTNRDSITSYLARGFCDYLAKGDTKTIIGSPSNDAKLGAFLVAFHQMHETVFETIFNTFGLSENSEMFLPSIRNEIKMKYYDVAARAVVELKLQSHFKPEEILFPLYLDKDYRGLSLYIIDDKTQQQQFVQFLDQFYVAESELEALVKRYNVSNNQKYLLSAVSIYRDVKRYSKRFGVPKQFWPNVKQVHDEETLNFILVKKYRDSLISDLDFDDYVMELVGDSEKLQEKLVCGMAKYGDVEGAAFFTTKYKVPLDVVPEDVKVAIANGECERKYPVIPPYDTILLEWRSEASRGGPRRYVPDELSPRCVTTPEDFQVALEDIVKFQKGAVVAIDCEWKPVFDFEPQKLSLLQLATRDEIIIVDILEMKSKLQDRHWSSFKDLLVDENILKLGYTFNKDFFILENASPILKDVSEATKNFIEMTTLCNNVLNKRPDIFPYYDKEMPTTRSLECFVQLCFGTTLDKIQQLSNWERRPLNNYQLIYAEIDVYCLMDMYQVLWTRARELEVDLLPFTSKMDIRRSNK